MNDTYASLDFNELTHWGQVIYVSVIQPSFVQITACRLVDAKPLSEPMMEY